LELDTTVLAAATLVALALDRGLGEPPARVLPVVWMGRLLEALGRRIAPPAGSASPSAMMPSTPAPRLKMPLSPARVCSIARGGCHTTA
jgi:hypothetical protein